MSRRCVQIVAMLAVAATLGACGRKSELAPPEDTQVPYTYPKQYPNPATVQPTADEEAVAPRRLPPPRAGDLSPFPVDRTTTTTYQSAPVQ